jgi:hypothetical protein
VLDLVPGLRGEHDHGTAAAAVPGIPQFREEALILAELAAWGTLGITHSACGECVGLVPAKLLTDGVSVYLRRFCRVHGESQSLVYTSLEEYLRCQRFLKPAWQPDAPQSMSKAACPQACGLCASHEQHLCLPIIEITSHCDLACPICINSSGNSDGWHMKREEFRGILASIFRGERQVDLLNLSGGEPLLHPDLFGTIDDALADERVVRVSLSTNGLKLLEDPRLIEGLRERDVVVSLQMDGLEERPFVELRGAPLLDRKLRILDLLGSAGVTASLVMTAAGGLSERLFRGMLDLLFGSTHIVSLMIQPLAFTGRAAALRGHHERLTIPDIVRLLGAAGHPGVTAGDFVPLPCSHPLCFSLAFYLMLDGGGSVSINRLADASTVMDSLANRMFYGLDPEEHRRLRDMIYDLWSGPVGAVPDGEAVLNTLRGILRQVSRQGCGCFDPRTAFGTFEKRVKSIFIHAFQDAETFDLARVRRCCQAYPQRDGTLVPACVRNVLRPA